MHTKSQAANSIVWAIAWATAVALLVLLVAVAARAQNPVPPTAREAAASPAFAAKLHPATRPAMNKPRASARARGTLGRRQSSSCSSRPSPQDQVIYENGPINGTTDAWTINFGYIVSDTFVPTASSVIGFDLGVWEFPGDSVTSVQWSITSGPNSGTMYGSGTVSGSNLTDQFISTNQFGYDIDKVSALGLNVIVTSGQTYWINIQNAAVPSGDPVFWDENSGNGCHSSGCPSQAVESGVGTIASEAFDITGGGLPQQCYESAGNMQIIHDFSGKGDGSNPSGVVADSAGNVYGAMSNMVYEIASQSEGWVFNTLYTFTGGANGSSPSTPIVGPEGALYGSTLGGSNGLGLIYSLRPPPTICLTAMCPWTESVVYQPTGNNDVPNPGNLVFDQAGNLYGTSGSGGTYGKGAVFELTASPSGWTESILYSFTGGSDGSGPGSLVVSNDGNLYGTGGGGAYGQGMIFQFVRPLSGGNWTENVIYSFTGDPNKGDGKAPYSLVQGGPGSLAGLAVPACRSGLQGAVVFLLSPSQGSWVFSVISSACVDVDVWSNTSLAADAADNVYWAGGDPSLCIQPGWVDTWRFFPITQGSELYSVEQNVFLPSGQLGLDANRNVYGTTGNCGKYNLGTVWRLTN